MIKNIIANWSHIILSILSVFILYPFFIGTLGEEQYGIWLLIVSATGYFSLLQMGVPMANVRFISYHYSRREYGKVNEVVSTNLVFFAAGGLLIFLLGFGVSSLLHKLFDIPSQYLRVAQIATLIVCAEISLRFVFEVYEGFFHAMQEFILFNIIKNLMLVIRVIVTMLLLEHVHGLIWLSSIILAITILQSLFFFILIKRKNSYLKINFKYVKFSVFKKIFGYSIFVLLLQLSGRIGFHSDALVLGSVVSVSSVVWFNAGNNLLLYFSRFMSGISQALMPKISEAESKGDIGNIGSHYVNYSRIVMLLVLPACLSFWLFGGDFIALWIGEEYRVVSGTVLSILTMGYCIYFVQTAVGLPILMGMSKVKFPTIIMFIASLINLAISIWLGSIYGIYGVAWGTAIPIMLVSLILIAYVCHVFSVDFLNYCKITILYPSVAAIPYLLIYYFIFKNVTIDSYLNLIFALGLCLVSYFTVAFFVFLTSIERSAFLTKILSSIGGQTY